MHDSDPVTAGEQPSRDELATRGLRQQLAYVADELHAAIDEGLSAEQLHDVVAIWEAETEGVTFDVLVDDGTDGPCDDCGTPTTRHDEDGRPTEAGWEYYMVLPEVWSDADAENARYLCIGCLEKRLGRQLTSGDFTEANINKPDGLETTRMRDRLGAQ